MVQHPISEVDQIEERLRGPVNCWLSNVQQIDFARLLVLARYGEDKLSQMKDSIKAVPVYDRPPILPSF